MVYWVVPQTPVTLLLVLNLALAIIVCVQGLAIYRLRLANKERLKKEKASGTLAYLSKLLANTQEQLDTLIYSMPPSPMIDKIKRIRPPRAIPAELVPEYTLGGRIPIHERYRGRHSTTSSLVYTREAIDANIDSIRKKKNVFPRYGQTNHWLFDALSKHPIRDKDVVVMGSNKPWFESVCLAYGGRCTTIEYNRIVSEHPDVRTLTPAEYDKDPKKFDAAFSISSFEHDGLGRYGDPLNPSGDLEAMKKMKSTLKPGSILFLAVPVGKDAVVWNANRVYGRIRLPLLFEGWKLVESFGFDEKLLDSEKNPFEPVFVLENKN